MDQSQNPSYLVYGAGALGSVLGGFLQKIGRPCDIRRPGRAFPGPSGARSEDHRHLGRTLHPAGRDRCPHQCRGFPEEILDHTIVRKIQRYKDGRVPGSSAAARRRHHGLHTKRAQQLGGHKPNTSEKSALWALASSLVQRSQSPARPG